MDSQPIPAMLLAVALALALLYGCQYSASGEIMSTYYEIRAANHKEAYAALRALERINSSMDIYSNNSEISRLNTEKTQVVGDELRDVINASLFYAALSNGSFDITINPVIQLYRHAFNDLNRSPTEVEIRSALGRVSYKNIHINGKSITLDNNASIDLGGIAKGYAIDMALSKMSEGMVNLGGQVGVKGKRAYTVALADPQNTDNVIAEFKLREGCISTSGNYERYFDKSRNIHHIMDSRTGKSVQGLISVTVIGEKKRGIDCDALSTSVFVLGKERGLGLIESLDGFEALIIDENNTIIRSKGIGRYER